MSDAPPAFAELFQEHLHPRLARLCIAQARCVAADVTTLNDAYDSVMRYARRFGALLLPEIRLNGLRDWILHNLIEEAFRAETEGWGSWLEDNDIIGGRAL